MFNYSLLINYTFLHHLKCKPTLTKKVKVHDAFILITALNARYLYRLNNSNFLSMYVMHHNLDHKKKQLNETESNL